MPSLAVLGTGQVGQAIARRAAEVGYEVTVGARTATSPGLDQFRDDAAIANGTFADAVASAPLVVNATNGLYSLDALTQVGAEALAGKTLVDVANELRPVEHGYPQPVATAQDSLGARLQRAFPETGVVKTLNTMNNAVMVRPAAIPGDHLVFLSGDSPPRQGRHPPAPARLRLARRADDGPRRHRDRRSHRDDDGDLDAGHDRSRTWCGALQLGGAGGRAAVTDAVPALADGSGSRPGR